MRLRSLGLLLAVAPMLALAQTKVQMKFFANGVAVGENTYEISADGAFQSSTVITAGEQSCSSTATGRIKDAKLLEATSESTQTGGSIKVVFASGQVSVTMGDQSQETKWVDKTGALFGHLHPQFIATTLLLAEKAAKADPAIKSTTLQTYAVDRGVSYPVTVTLLPSKDAIVNGKKVTARMFKIDGLGAPAFVILDDSGSVAVMDIPQVKQGFAQAGWEPLLAKG